MNATQPVIVENLGHPFQNFVGEFLGILSNAVRGLETDPRKSFFR
jgi:uncharacterized protein (DUF2461 family)